MLKHGARRAAAIAGQSHGRVVVARSIPRVLSTGEPRRMAPSDFLRKCAILNRRATADYALIVT
jgi:hypothetical protein